MSQRGQSPRRGSGSPRRGRSPGRASSGELNAAVKPTTSTLDSFTRLIIPICTAVLGCLVIVLVLRSYVLLFAARSMAPLVPVFLELGADPKITDRHGGSALHALCASASPTDAIYRALVAHGADISATDFFALQPVHYCSVSSPSLALQLLRDGARPSSGSPSFIHPLLEALLAGWQTLSDDVMQYIKTALALSRPETVNIPLGQGLSPLATAFMLRVHASSSAAPTEVAEHALDLAKLLIDNGAQPNTVHPDGAPLLHLCLQFCGGLRNADEFDDAEARREFLDVLLASPALNVSERDGDMRTPLFFACNASLVSLLVERGASPNAVSLLDETPLEYHLRLLHDSSAPAEQAGVIAALHKHGAHLGEKPALLSALVLHDSALNTPLSDHLSQLVEFAVREAHLPLLRVLDVREQEAELCVQKRDIAFYTKHQIPPIKSVLDGVLEIAANGTFIHSFTNFPAPNSPPATQLRIPLRELDRVYIRNADEDHCLVIRAALRSNM